MRINSIEISNFRQYQYLKLDFPRNGSHDLHIICADNGVGKTNILNAITWCLYGDEPHLGSAATSLPRLNLAAKRKAKDNGQDEEVINVKIFVEDSNERIQFERKQRVLINEQFEVKDEFFVYVSKSGMDAVCKSDEEANAYVEKYMPRRIRQYFYFDGEQLDSYFISDDSTKIKETIHAISQVDVVTSVKERLQKIVVKKQNEAGKKTPKIDEINKELQKLDKELQEAKESFEAIKQAIAESTRIIKENSDHLSGQENLPELEAKYQKLKKLQCSLQEKKSDLDKKIFAFVRDMKVCLTFYPAAKATLDVIEEKQANNALPPDIDKEILEKIIITHKCGICGHVLTEDDIQKIRDMLDKIQVSSQTSNLLMSIRDKLTDIVNRGKNYQIEKASIIKEQKELETRIQECDQDLQDVDDQISKFSNKEQVIQWHNERKKHEHLKDINLQKKGALEIQMNTIDEKMKSANDKLSKELAKEEQLKQLNAERGFLLKVKSIVEEIENEMMGEVKDKMQERTRDFFLDLIWKKNVYTQINLDDAYQLDLIHKDGYSCVGSCSAAERSLLALAFTLALHEVSGFSALLFIDTPVARVTSQNRTNFANVLGKVSENKQLIMTFTPDEYSENVKKVFEPIAATSVRLTMNSDQEITTIVSA